MDMEALDRFLREQYRPAIEVQLAPTWFETELAEERRAAFEALPLHRRALVLVRQRLRSSVAGRAIRRAGEAWGVLLHGLPESDW